MWKLACGAVFIVLLGATHAVPACKGGCQADEGDSQFCDSTCYTTVENTLFTISTKFGTTDPKCTDGTGTCPTDLADFSFENCQKECTGDCGAFIKDTNSAGDRCRFITDCLTLEEAGGIVPCDDCASRRSCSSCPSFTYKGGSTMVHWLCEMQGDAYDDTNKPAEGVECKPTANCAKSEDGTPKPASITCAAGESGQDGKWMDGDTEVAPELLVDLPCNCNSLRIPEATDTNVFCDVAHTPSDGNYIIESGDKCELVCDGQVFIPIECRFTADKSSASWNIEFDGETVDLGADANCLACSLDNCEEEQTESPFMNNY